MLDTDDLDSAMTDAGRNPGKASRRAKAEAEQRKKIHEPDQFGRNKDVGGNVGHEAHKAGLPDDHEPEMEYEEGHEKEGHEGQRGQFSEMLRCRDVSEAPGVG